MTQKMMILSNSYHTGEKIRNLCDWHEYGVEIIAVEHNGAIGLEQFAYFRPGIVILDSLIPVIGVDRFIDEMSLISRDFLVILLGNENTQSSNLNNVCRILDREVIDREMLIPAVRDAVRILNAGGEIIEKSSFGDRIKILENILGNADFSITNLQHLRSTIGLEMTSRISVLLPRPSGEIRGGYSEEILLNIKNILNMSNGGEVFVMNDGILCILVNDVGSLVSERVYEDIIFEIRRILVNNYQEQWVFAMSDPVSLVKLNKAFPEVRRLYDYGYFFSDTPVLKREYVPKSDLFVKTEGIKIQCDPIWYAVLNGNKEESENEGRAIESLLKHQMSFALAEQYKIRIEIICTVIKMLLGVDYDLSAFDSTYQTLEKETEVYEKVLHDMCAIISDIKLKKNELVFTILLNMINDYDTSLSLQDAADKVNIAATYLSHLLKKETGYTFNNWLTIIRITAAKRMIRGRCYKINTIAELVGYEDSRYFSRVFKKETGMTPTEYQSVILQEMD